MAGIGDTKYIIKAHPTTVRKFNPNNIIMVLLIYQHLLL